FSQAIPLAFLLVAAGEAKPSHHHHFNHHFNHFDGHHLDALHALPHHLDYAVQEAVLPAPAPVLPAVAPPPAFAPSPVYAPAPLLPAPSPLLPAPAPLLPAAAPLLPAPAPLLPAPACLPAAAPLLPEFHLPTVHHHVLPPVLEAVPFAPSYRAIPGPKTTTHKVSVGYAFPKLLAKPHVHLKALPLKWAHHKDWSLF
ncbi:hypothetical protein KR032_001334, partial [Drosophila birchii]